MKKLIDKIKKFEILMRSDKALHFLWMFFLQLIFCYLFKLNVYMFIIPIIFAVGKEIYDLKIKKSYMDLIDMIATFLGGYISILLYYLITK